MDVSDDKLRCDIIEFYREEIRRRYQLDRMRQVDEFDGFPDEMLETFRDFFLERLYPPREVREELDAALEHLGLLLRSPKRLGPLLRSAWMSLIRLGAHLPSAIAAGIATVDTLREAHKLEASMINVARAQRLVPQNAADRRTMIRMIAGAPEGTVRNLIHDVIRLFEALSNVKMLSGMLRIVERCQDAMNANPELYGEDEREGLALALDVLRGGHDMFMLLEPKDFPRIIKGIETIELNWCESVQKEARKLKD